MRLVSRSVFLGGLVTAVLVGAHGIARAGQEPGVVSTPEPDNVVHSPDQFAGTWDYNAEESVNAATGRREQAPQSATQRGAGARGGGAAPGRGGGGGGGGGLGGGGGRGGGGFGAGGGGGNFSTPDMIRENRSASRDLMEIPEALTISVAPAAVTFTDDLDRTRTYPTDGRKQRYTLGAARFEAQVNWVGSQLKKNIEAAYGLKMSETYFLSPDAHRLFVIIRVGGEEGRGERGAVRVTGANRVYDRVE